MRSGPLRFLALAVGLWIGARAAILLPGLWPQGSASDMPIVTSASAAPTTISARPEIETAFRPAKHAGTSQADTSRLMRQFSYQTQMRGIPWVRAISAAGSNASIGFPAARMPDGPVGAPRAPTVASILPQRAAFLPAFPGPRNVRAFGRWSATAWLLVRREEGGTALAQGGTLGGSQAGARIGYRLGGGLSLGARVYAPLRRTDGAEVAVDLDWQPAVAVPVHLRAERRQALGRAGRSAFALLVHGGASQALPRRLRLDLYGQAGVVGTRSRDLFVDGAARLSVPLGPVEIGAGVWGAAQPGAARLDAGPGISYRLPVRGANVRLEASWRFRLAGDAAPRSGPALTLGADF